MIQNDAKETRLLRVKKIRRRLIAVGMIAAACITALLLLRNHAQKKQAEEEAAARKAAQEAAMHTEVQADEVLHLSFPQLIVSEAGTRADEETQAGLTTEEFRQVLARLYEAGYVLVDIHDVAAMEDRYEAQTITLPAGKKALVLSQRNVSYAAENTEQGYATGIEVTDDGTVENVYLDADGQEKRGSFDVMTCVEDFVRAHPDFSHEGARGILAVTGHAGVLGYGEVQKAACEKVVEALKNAGWIFASYTYGAISYGSETAMVEADAKQWNDEVAPLVGGTDILVLPWKADIGDWSGYAADDPKFRALHDLGFRYFCIENNAQETWLQVGETYVRQGMHEIDTMEQFEALMDGGTEALAGIETKDEITGEDAEADPEEEEGGLESEEQDS